MIVTIKRTKDSMIGAEGKSAAVLRHMARGRDRKAGGNTVRWGSILARATGAPVYHHDVRRPTERGSS